MEHLVFKIFQIVGAFKRLNPLCAVSALQNLAACPPIDDQGNFILPGKQVAVIMHIVEADRAEVVHDIHTGRVLLPQQLVIHGKGDVVYI